MRDERHHGNDQQHDDDGNRLVARRRLRPALVSRLFENSHPESSLPAGTTICLLQHLASPRPGVCDPGHTRVTSEDELRRLEDWKLNFRMMRAYEAKVLRSPVPAEAKFGGHINRHSPVRGSRRSVGSA
jgi:hypothetical protein